MTGKGRKSMSSNLFDMTNKVALITGSSKGIGRAIAEEMARQGAKVVISSRKADVCQEVADAINAEAKASGNETGEAIVIPAHVGQREALQHLVDETRARLGSNRCAGLQRGGKSVLRFDAGTA
jgi:NAD(P)-dependent dehydrogenase (short-subunit alcohol dehydrogenase family)